MPLEADIELLIGQWSDSPKLQAAIQAGLDALGEVMDAFDSLSLMQQIDTAEGVWLDYIGARLGLRRPATTDPQADARFGFTGPAQSRGFDLAPFKGDAANDAVFPLPDAIYRRFIRARAVLVLSDGALHSFIRAVRMIDPAAAVQDRRNMKIRIITAHADLLMLADSIGALPRNAGVQLEYLAQGAFGYDDAGEPFDQGPFR